MSENVKGSTVPLNLTAAMSAINDYITSDEKAYVALMDEIAKLERQIIGKRTQAHSIRGRIAGNQFALDVLRNAVPNERTENAT